MSKKKKEPKYEFVVPKYGNLDAGVAAKELERIRKKYGILDPKQVVLESIPESAPLHNVFNWDDTEAALKWRQKQAGDLIRNIRVIVTNKQVNTVVRAYVNVKTDLSVDNRQYIPIEEAIVNDDAYADLLAQSKDDMESFITKYSQIQELNPIKAEMLKALNNV